MAKETTELNVWMGKRFSELRGEAGLSQNKTADLMNVSRVTISNIEKGIQTINSRDLYNASILFDVSPADFYPAQDSDGNYYTAVKIALPQIAVPELIEA